MDGVGTPIIGRPRPLPDHDTPNPANNTYTLNYEEPENHETCTSNLTSYSHTNGHYTICPHHCSCHKH